MFFKEVIVRAKVRAGCIVGICFLLVCCSGTKPTTLGVKQGKLSPCPDSPNCVSSTSRDSRHAMEPLDYTGDMQAAKQKLVDIVSSFKRARIMVDDQDYIHAEFASALFKFVDDVEFYFDDEHKVIHFRSASRLGKYDFGVNRKRMDKIRQRFYKD